MGGRWPCTSPSGRGRTVGPGEGSRNLQFVLQSAGVVNTKNSTPTRDAAYPHPEQSSDLSQRERFVPVLHFTLIGISFARFQVKQPEDVFLREPHRCRSVGFREDGCKQLSFLFQHRVNPLLNRV